MTLGKTAKYQIRSKAPREAWFPDSKPNVPERQRSELTLGFSVLGPGIMVSAGDVRILRIKGRTIEARMGRHNYQQATFDSADSARCHFDALVLDLTKLGFVPVCENFVISSRHVTKIYHEVKTKPRAGFFGWLFCCCMDDRYVGQKAVVEFDGGAYRWGWDFTNADNATAFLEPIVQKCRRAAVASTASL